MIKQNGKAKGIENNSKKEEIRIGVYICHCGGNISDVVDVEKVTQAVAGLPDVVVAKNYVFMCSDPGQNLIAEDIRENKLNRVVVAACSPSLHELTFRQTLMRSGLNPFLFEPANIREQVSWAHHSVPGAATEKAISLVAAGVAKARFSYPLEPIRIGAKKHVVVLGGGVSGLRSARDLSRRGFKVTLLERTPFLGGRMAQLGRLYPTEDLARDILQSLLSEAIEDHNITIYTLAEVKEISGYMGDFHLKVQLNPRGVTEELDFRQFDKAVESCPVSVDSEFDYGLLQHKAIYLLYPGCYPQLPAIDWKACTRCGKCAEAVNGKGIILDAGPEETELDAGAIVLATGFDNYEPRRGEFGYGEYPQVITLPQLKRILDSEGPTEGNLKHNGRNVKNVALIHCVGSRQLEGIHEPGPDGNVNNYCSRYCCTATLQVANEIRERFPEVNIFDFYQDIRTYGRGHEDYYENASKNGVLFFRYRAEEAPEVTRLEDTDNSQLLIKVKDTLTWGEEIEVPVDLIVLSTGMVPRDISDLVEMLKLPRGPDRFLQEVHPKLQPVESAVSGVFLAGTCQGPMDITESCAAAEAVAAKTTALLAKGYIESDPFVARVDLGKCEGTGECVVTCSFTNAIALAEYKENGKKVMRAKVNTAMCKGCGMCVPACPHGAIQIEGWRLDQYQAMVDAIVAEH